MKLTLKAKVVLSAVFSAVLTGVVAIIVYSNVSSMLHAIDKVKHTNHVIAEFNTLMAMMVDMETGERGYLMSGDEKFLEPFNNAKAGFDDQLAKLKSTVSADNAVSTGPIN